MMHLTMIYGQYLVTYSKRLHQLQLQLPHQLQLQLQLQPLRKDLNISD